MGFHRLLGYCLLPADIRKLFPSIRRRLIGDICNLVGAALANLLPTVIILAAYYSLCDIILMIQIYFYRWKRGRQGSEEETPLLAGNDSGNSVQSTNKDFDSEIYSGTDICVWSPSKHPTAAVKWSIQILGWSSALCYLGSRIPQIVKNLETHCEGLSPALFFFAIVGNLSYSLSIIAKSTDGDYLNHQRKLASWICSDCVLGLYRSGAVFLLPLSHSGPPECRGIVIELG
ncbi:hypothetical protein B0H16DRAFT_299303 [Mycena metata]|uniref:Uncharacterized protein n=1 Tax=Mycena metata TaxID=1033252 RepID=A0AAD7P276_9AGAR|nr:hypothetical protein B0H16DRAFT_299303 [Mycena metata]